MYETEFKRIITASKNNSLTFFVGAGVSALSDAPTWSSLIDDICRKMGRKAKGSYSSDEYLQIPQMFYYSIDKNIDVYYDFIENHLSVSPLMPNILHKKLLSFNPSSLITTNFDDLLEDAAIQYCQSFKSIACDTEVPSINGDRFILKVHGDIRHKNIVFKEEDYLNYSENFKLLETLLKSIFSTNTVVFIGYGLNDYNIKLILNWVKALLKDDFNKPIFIYTGSALLTSEDLLYQESKGLRVIEYEKVGKHFDDYLPRYLSVIEAIKKSADLTYEGKTEQEAFEVTYELLKPLDKLNALRISDIIDKLSPNVRINEDGTIISAADESIAIKYFFNLNSLTPDEYNALPKSIKEKYQLILSVFAKAQVRLIETKHKRYSFINGSPPFADSLCIAFDFNKMHSFTKKKYKTMQSNYEKAFYFARIRKYDEAFFLFVQVANEAFKSKEYLLYYFAEANRINLYKIVKRINSLYGCYDRDRIDALSPGDDAEQIFKKLPVEFQNEYATLKDLHSVNMLYKYSYEATLDGQKLQKAIESHSMELGLTSSVKVICRINESLHFLLGNHLVVDEFTEYKNTINNLMSLLLYKYSTQSDKILHEQMFPDIGQNKVNFDELDFYCFIEFFEAKELISLFSKNHIETIEFKNIDAIETAVHNILNYYEAIQKQLQKSIEVLRLQTQIKTCLALLRYTDISQALVERLCMFIFKYDFRDILINDKVMFLNGQLAQRNKYSSITAKIIEDKLIWYIDSHIHALKIGKPFDSLSTNSTINYSDLVRYVAPRDMQYHSYRLSIRISEIIKSDLSSLFPHIVEYYWAYISTSQRRRVVTWAKAKLAENFSFDLLMLLLECNARIGESIISSLKEYLSTSIEKSLKATENSKGISFPRKDPYQELNQVGYWCLIKTLPPKFSEFVGYSDSFDFYYLYKKFDFKKFNAAWLLNLYPHTLEAIAKDIKVKNKIRFVIADTLNREKLTESDQTKLLSILTGYFC